MLECLNKKKIKDTLYRSRAAQRNHKHAPAFASVPFKDRVIFVPQCMRNVKVCKAKEEAGYYLCAECGGCKVGDIRKKSRELGYKALYILKGGRIVEKLIRDLAPKAIVGVACFYEGAEGMKLCEENGITVQFVPLTRDGCVDTDVDLTAVFETISRFKP